MEGSNKVDIPKKKLVCENVHVCVHRCVCTCVCVLCFVYFHRVSE